MLFIFLLVIILFPTDMVFAEVTREKRML